MRPRVCLTPALSLFQESEPISHYLHAEIATELRQRLAKMGMDMLLKMVGTWLRLEVKVVLLQKLFSWGNKTIWLKRTCLLPVSPTLPPVDSKIELCLLEQTHGCQVSCSDPAFGPLGHCTVLELTEGGSVLHVQCNTRS